MARMLTDVMEREAYEDALDPLPDDDLPSVDIDDLDASDAPDDDDPFEEEPAALDDPFDPDVSADTVDADGEPLPDDVQAEIEALAAEGLADETEEVEAEIEARVGTEVGADVRTEVESRADETHSLEEALAAAQHELARQREIASAAVARYREAMLAVEPDLPPEMVRGESVEDVDASIVAARTMVARVRERVEARRPSERGFPAGAPARESSARGHLTARQKIAAGLQERMI